MPEPSPATESPSRSSAAESSAGEAAATATAPLRLVHLTPGTGSFICGSCLRDNALGTALRGLGHDATLVPLYLPFALEDPAAAPGPAVHMGGINMYLQQKLPLWRFLPGPLARLLDSPRLLRWAARQGDMTSAAEHGAMTVSMLEGESGRLGAEVDKLGEWLAREEPPDVVCLSNSMLVGVVRRLKATLGRPIVCSLQGEAPFLDHLLPPYRERAWQMLAERAAEVDAFVAVSRYTAELMADRLAIDPKRIHLVHNGVEAESFYSRDESAPPAIGYLARMCADKGLDTLVDAFIALRQDGGFPGLKLKVAGAQLKPDVAFVAQLKARLAAHGLAADAEFAANVDRETKLRFLQGLSVLSVPATYGESFGLFVLEALASGVPVVQPRHAAFPEILEATGGGLLCEPDDAASLAASLGRLLRDPVEARRLGDRGQRAVRERFTTETMARSFEKVCRSVLDRPGS